METPTINVNLKPCTCHYSNPLVESRGLHTRNCLAAPILLPCPIPRPVTFEVRLGECDNGIRLMHMPGAVSRCGPSGHHSSCPARPVKVSCSISGATWEESHLSAWETEDGIGLNTTEEARAADERWAIVQALVLGYTGLSAMLTGPRAAELIEQRDAVYAALADMARARAKFRQGSDSVQGRGDPRPWRHPWTA